MPNYSLVIDSKFKPFSYQELAAPLDRQELYHEKLAEEYDNLSKQADVLEIMAGNEQDKNSGSYSRYKSYSDALRKEADNLYRFGLNTESRQRLSDLRRIYNTDIVPIQNAWSKREKEADEQMKASLQNPSIMFTRDARSTTLDDYIKNPTGGYGVINGANITAQMATMAKNLEKQILDGSARKEAIDPYTYDYIRKYGLTADMVRDWRNNPTLSKMFEQVMQANGVTPEALQGSLNAQSIIDKSTGYAEMGMWNAIGEDKAQVLENYGARLAAQEAKEKRMADYKAQLQGNQTRRNEGNIPLFFDQITSPNMEGKQLEKDANNALKFVQEIEKNGGKQLGMHILGKGKPTYVSVNVVNNGKIKSLNTFVEEGLQALRKAGIDLTSEEVRNTYKTRWTNEYLGKVQPYIKLAGTEEPTINNIKVGINAAIKNTAPYTINALEFRFGDNNGKVLAGLMPKLMMSDNKTYIREIESIDRSGKINASSKYLDSDEFVDTEGKAKGIPLFYRINSPSGSNNVIMKIGSKSYLIPGDKLGNIFGESNIDVNNMYKLYQKRRQLIDTYGEEAYWNDSISAEIENSLNNYGAASVRRASTGIAGSYKLPQFGLNTTTEDRLE